MKTTATELTVKKAIELVNKEKGYFISLNRCDQQGKYFNFTLKAETGKPGARYSHSGRHLPSASWHAHGYVIDKIFELQPESIIYSLGEKFNVNTWYWQDKNVGSIMNPVQFSELSIH